MIKINYAPRFSRDFWKLSKELQLEALEAMRLFTDTKNHQYLQVHKLHGHLKDRYSFSVNYEYRIVFKFVSKNEVNFLAVGGHDVYKK